MKSYPLPAPGYMWEFNWELKGFCLLIGQSGYQQSQSMHVVKDAVGGGGGN